MYYQLHLAASGVAVPTLNQTGSVLRSFFKVALRRCDIVEHTAFINEPRKLPVVLGPDEVARLLAAAPGLKYKAASSVAYGVGLRVSEVAALKATEQTAPFVLVGIRKPLRNRLWHSEGGRTSGLAIQPA